MQQQLSIKIIGFIRVEFIIILISLISFFSCTKVKYGFTNPWAGKTIIFEHDFENNSIGIYNENEWQADWNFPQWSNRNIPPEIVQNDDPTNNSKVMRWYFPQGALGPAEGGGQWFSEIDSVYREVWFSYKINFKPEFDWVLGGKIPGLAGGPQWDGFDPPEWDDGFLILLMWNSEANLEFYYYHQDQTHIYGDSKKWNCTLLPDTWHFITIRIVMNSVSETGGSNDGILEGFFDGRLACQITNLRFRNLDNIGIDMLYIVSFFGGADDDWAANRDEWIEVDDFVVYYYDQNSGMPVGNIPSHINQNITLIDF